MKCPACQRETPMSFKCRACGAELMRRAAGGASPRAAGASPQRVQPRPVDDMKVTMPVSALRLPRPTNGETPPPIPFHEPGQADDNPYASPEESSVPYREFATTLTSETPAGRLPRLGAVLLNSFFSLVAMTPGIVMMWSQLGALVTMAEDPAAGANPGLGTLGAGLAVALLGSLALLVYQAVLFVRTGQTLGKKICGIRVVNVDDGQVPSWVKSILLREVVNAIPQSLPLVGPFYALVDLLFIFRADRRCVHDLIAGTKVVAAR